MTAVTACPAWCTNGDRCSHGEHWSDDLMIYTPASVMTGLTEIGLPPQVGAGPVGHDDGTTSVVVHVDVAIGDLQVDLTAAEAREFARHVLVCADALDGGETS